MVEQHLAYRDELTGAYNRRFLTQLFEDQWAELQAQHDRVSLIVIDLDSFKEINDRHGHPVGDAALCGTVELLADHFREDDMVVRYGGDEFVVVLPGAGDLEAAELAERARAAGAERRLEVDVPGGTVRLPIEFSVGVGSCPADGDGGEAVFAIADARLYADKRRRHRGRRIRAWALRGLALAAFGVALLLAPRLFEGREPWADRRPPVVTRVAPGIVPGSAEVAASEKEAELRQRIAELQAELSRKQAEEDTRAQHARTVDQARASDARFAAMQAKIEHLQADRRALVAAAAEASRPAPPKVDPPVTAVPAVESGDDGVASSAIGGGTGVGVESEVGAVAPAPAEVAPAEVARAEVAPAEVAPAEVAPAAVARLPKVDIPRLVHQGRAVYPEIERRQRRTARVEVRVRIDASGVPVEAVVQGDVRPTFARAARRAALRSKFLPGTRDGRPITSYVTLFYNFEENPRR